MRIAIPLAKGRLSMHFGHCEEFAIVEVDENAKQVSKTTNLQPPDHQPGVLPAWLHEHGANVIIAGGMGQRAQQLFAEHNIDVIVGAPAHTVDDLVTAYLNGELELGQNICDH